MRGRRLHSLARLLLAVAVVASAVGVAAVPAAGQATDGGDAGGDSSADRRCFPPGGHDLGIGDGNPHINVTIHTSLFTSPAPPSALGLSARGVALDADIVALRTGVLFEGIPEGIAASEVWDSFVVLFDYRLSLPMFAGATDSSTYEPTGGPVSGVETRRC